MTQTRTYNTFVLFEPYNKPLMTEDAKIFSLETVLLIHRVADIQMMLMAGAFADVPSNEYLSFAKWQIPHPP